MKNLFLTIALGLILLTSCSKEETTEQIETHDINYVHVLNQMNQNTFWDVIKIDELERSTNNSNTIIAQTNGNYVPISRDGMYITWSGSQSENGARGTAEIKQESPNSSFHFILETECVRAEGNEAVYGGTITKLKSNLIISPHIDKGNSLKDCKRTHIPIKTHPNCIFTIGGETKHLKEGEIWEINNFQKEHSVENNSNEDRIHMI